MIWFLLYLGCCLSTSIVGFTMTYRQNETMAWVILATLLSFVFAPVVWLCGLGCAFQELCDRCDVRRGLRVPKTHRICYDADWWTDWSGKNFRQVMERWDFYPRRSIERQNHWAVFDHWQVTTVLNRWIHKFSDPLDTD